MARAYSEDLREKIVSVYEQGGGSAAKIALRFGVSPATVLRLKELKKKTGGVACPPRRRRTCERVFDDLSVLADFVRENPDLSLKEIGAHFGCSDVWICLQLKKIGYTYKKNLRVRRAKHRKTEGFLSGA
jgi:transposase